MNPATEQTAPVPTSRYKVAKVVLNTNAATIALSGTVQLTATAKDSNNVTVGGVNFFWESRNTQIAMVSQTGLVTAYVGRTPNGHNKNVGGSVNVYAHAKRDDGSLDTAIAFAVITVQGQ